MDRGSKEKKGYLKQNFIVPWRKNRDLFIYRKWGISRKKRGRGKDKVN